MRCSGQLRREPSQIFSEPAPKAMPREVDLHPAHPEGLGDLGDRPALQDVEVEHLELLGPHAVLQPLAVLGIGQAGDLGLDRRGVGAARWPSRSRYRFRSASAILRLVIWSSQPLDVPCGRWLRKPGIGLDTAMMVSSTTTWADASSRPAFDAVSKMRRQ